MFGLSWLEIIWLVSFGICEFFNTFDDIELPKSMIIILNILVVFVNVMFIFSLFGKFKLIGFAGLLCWEGIKLVGEFIITIVFILCAIVNIFS